MIYALENENVLQVILDCDKIGGNTNNRCYIFKKKIIKTNFYDYPKLWKDHIDYLVAGSFSS